MQYIGTIEETDNASNPWGSTIEINGREIGFYISNYQNLPASVIEKIKRGQPQAGFFQILDDEYVRYLNPRNNEINY